MPVLGGVRKPVRFRPTHEELISEHLKPKILGEYKGDEEVIGEIDLSNVEPWDLPGLSKLKSDDQVWYFLSRRNFMKNRVKFNRKTKAGSWKSTGRNLTIKDSRTMAKIGTKRTFVFYLKAIPKAVWTGWTIYEYEYTPEPKLTIQGDFVLIKLLKRDIKLKKKDEKVQIDDQTHHVDSVVENQIPCGVENQDTCCEGEPSCRISANFRDQSLNELTFSSAGTESQVSQYMASSDFEDCSLDELILNFAPSGVQVSYCLDSGFEYQNPSMLADIATNDGCLMASDFENHNPVMWAAMATNDSCLMASDFENQNPVMLAAMAADDSCPMASAFESQNYASEFRGELISSVETSPEVRSQSESIRLMASICKYQDEEAYIPASGEYALDFGKQNPYKKSNMSTSEHIDWHSSMTCFPQSNIPEGMAMSPELNAELQAEFTGDGTDLFSYFENQSPYDNSESCCLRASDFENQSTQNDNESSSLTATVLESQNTDNNTNISVSQEGQGNPLTATLLDFEPQKNPCMFDMSVLGEMYWSPPVEHNLEKYVAELGIKLPEEQSQIVEEWEAFLELKNCVNSNVVLQPTLTEEKPSYNGIEASVSN